MLPIIFAVTDIFWPRGLNLEDYTFSVLIMFAGNFLMNIVGAELMRHSGYEYLEGMAKYLYHGK